MQLAMESFVFCFLALLWPSVTAMEQEPVLVSCETTKGNIDIEVHKPWAPLGAQRFHVSMVVL